MMYFWSNTTDLVEEIPPENKINSPLSSPNHISKLVHPANRKLLERLLDKSRKQSVLSDILACLVSSYFVSGQLKQEYFFVNSLKTIRDNLYNEGFSAVSELDVTTSVSKYEHINYIVFGYQEERGLDRRVRAFCDFSMKMNKSQKAVFSGLKSKSAAELAVPDEAMYMRIKFEELCKARGFDASSINLILEAKSGDTIENLANCLSGNLLVEAESSRERQVLVLISSTFHLIRIAEQILQLVRTQGSSLIKYVDKIVLVGAEDATLELKSSDEIYVKNMMFDIFRKNVR